MLLSPQPESWFERQRGQRGADRMGVGENLQSTVKPRLVVRDGAGVSVRPQSVWRLLLFLSAICAGVLLGSPILLAIPQSTTKRAAEPAPNLMTSEDWNQRLNELMKSRAPSASSELSDCQIGPQDVLEISVFEAPEMNRQVRVSSQGEISMPLLGAVRAAGFTPRELEITLQELLRQTYMKDPHVSVFVRDIQSHPISVTGAVRKPGVFQVRGPKSLLEVLSLAEGLSDDAGETVIVIRGGTVNNFLSPSGDFSPAAPPDQPTKLPEARTLAPASGSGPRSSENVLEVNLKDLLNSTDPHNNPLVYPGDLVKVTRAGTVYVVGDVRKPGGFTLKSSEKLSVLQAIALSEGLLPTAAKSGARIYHTDQRSGERKETRLDLGKIMSGKSSDPILESNDIVFVPNSAARVALSRGTEAAAQTAVGLAIFHW